MVSIEPHTDDKGDWLFFKAGDARLLTAFARGRRGQPISVGWAGVTTGEELVNAWLEAALHQIEWRADNFGVGYSSRFRPVLRGFTYGVNKEEHQMDLNPPQEVEGLRQNLLWALVENQDDAQLLRLELWHRGEASESLEFAFWSRVDLSSEEAAAIPYGNTGIMIRTSDLRRKALEKCVAKFIVRSHAQRVMSQDAHSMLGTVLTRLSPVNGGKDT